MKLGILFLVVGCGDVIVAVMYRHLVLFGAGILILIVATLRIRAMRNRAKAASEIEEQNESMD